MLNLRTTLPEDDRGPGLPIRRTPTGGILQAVVTCDTLVACPTHYAGGRTAPCSAPDCKSCEAGIPWRWHAWVAAYDANQPEHFIFEMTNKGAEPVAHYKAKNGSLRGCIIRARRNGSKPNARVIIQTKPADLAKVWLPDEPDLVGALAIIWAIPRSTITVDGPRKIVPHLNVNGRLQNALLETEFPDPLKHLGT